MSAASAASAALATSAAFAAFAPVSGAVVAARAPTDAADATSATDDGCVSFCGVLSARLAAIAAFSPSSSSPPSSGDERPLRRPFVLPRGLPVAAGRADAASLASSGTSLGAANVVVGVAGSGWPARTASRKGEIAGCTWPTCGMACRCWQYCGHSGRRVLNWSSAVAPKVHILEPMGLRSASST